MTTDVPKDLESHRANSAARSRPTRKPPQSTRRRPLILRRSAELLLADASGSNARSRLTADGF